MASFNNPVDARVWGDGKFRNLSKAQPNAQTLWLFLLTGPHNRGLPGLYNTGTGDMAEILGWQPGDICAVARELTAGENPMLAVDWPARVLMLPQVFSYRPPASSSNLSAWVKPYDAIPESPLKARWLLALGKHCAGRSPEFFNAFRRCFAQQITEAGAAAGWFAAAMDELVAGVDNTPPAWGGAGGGADVVSTNTNANANAKATGPAAAPPEAMQAVDLLVMLMVRNDPKAKVPAAGSKRYGDWVSEVERLHRLDGRSWAEIEAVVQWCQDDAFWRSNILSAAKLREQFPKLRGQMDRKRGVSGRNVAEFHKALAGAKAER